MTGNQRQARATRPAGAGAGQQEWTTAEVLAYLAEQGRDIVADTWYAYVARGQAPQPVRRIGRTPLWAPAEVRQWHAESVRDTSRRPRARGVGGGQ